MTDAEVRLSRAAERDLAGIWRYGAERWGREQANAYARRLNDSFGRLAAMPDLGRVMPSRLGPLRMLPVGSHVVLYRSDTTGILILRVLAARQDWLAILGGDA